MGSYFTRLWWSGDPDIPDPISGMSKRDVFTVQRIWSKVNVKSAEYGMELFIRLFRKDPDTQKFFRNIDGLTEDKIKTTIVFKAHVQNLMSSINTAVVNLHTPEVVAALMNKLGTSHHKKHIEIKHFKIFQSILVAFFIDDIKINQAALSSLNKFFTFILRHIYEELKD